MVGELEAMYVEMLDSHGIVWSTCVSRFAEPLVARVPELLKRLSGDKLSVLFDSAIQNNTQNTPDFFFFWSLLNIVGPVRQAMRWKCQSTDASFKFDKASQIESVPIELLAPVNLILEGIDLWKGFFKRITFISPGNNFQFPLQQGWEKAIFKEEKTWPIRRNTLSPLHCYNNLQS